MNKKVVFHVCVIVAGIAVSCGFFFSDVGMDISPLTKFFIIFAGTVLGFQFIPAALLFVGVVRGFFSHSDAAVKL